MCAEQRVDLKGERTVCGRQLDHRVLGVPGAGRVGDVDPRPAQLFDSAVGPDSGGVVEDAKAVGLLLDDHDDRKVVEPQRHIEPMEAWILIGRFAGGFGLANRADAPRPVAGADPGGGVDCVLVAVDGERSLPRPHLGEAAGVKDGLAANAHDVGRLVDRYERALPRQVEREAQRRVVADQPQAAQRFDDLDAVGADALVEAVIAEGVGEVDGALLVAASQQSERVGDPEVRIHAEAGDQKQLVGAIVGVEVAAVIGVAVGAGDVRQRQRHLMQRVFVKWDGHCELLWVLSGRRGCASR